MKKLLLIIVVMGAAYQWYSSNDHQRFTGEGHDELIMYSLTTCGFCKRKAKELRQANIPFKEYYIDKDRSRMTELNEKLAAAGYEPRGYGTPIFDAYGHMMPNNPDLKKILKIRRQLVE